MKECPKCKRGYGDEMYYCLTDGCYLSPVRDPEETIRAPAPRHPQTTIAATPEIANLAKVEAQPTPKAPKPLTGLVLIALLWVSVIAFALYAAFKGTGTTQQSNSPGRTIAHNPTPSPAATAPTPGTAQEPAPKPTPAPNLAAAAVPPPKARVLIDEKSELKQGIRNVYFDGHAGDVIQVSLTSTRGEPFYTIRTSIGRDAVTQPVDMRGTWKGTLPIDGSYEVQLCCGSAERPIPYALKVILKPE
jgi:hypothetical protein